MITRRLIRIVCLKVALLGLFIGSSQAIANVVNINAPEWLGGLKLDQTQLNNIKEAVEKALASPIDAEQQCGKVRIDCVVRAAREWQVDGDRYREIVINIHTVGHASRPINQNKGTWPKIVAK